MNELLKNEYNGIIVSDTLEEKILNMWSIVKENVFKDNDILSEFISTQKNKLYEYHFGLGLYLRNNFIYPDKELYREFNECGVIHNDDISSIMIQIWHRALQEGRIK